MIFVLPPLIEKEPKNKLIYHERFREEEGKRGGEEGRGRGEEEGGKGGEEGEKGGRGDEEEREMEGGRVVKGEGKGKGKGGKVMGNEAKN